MHSLVSSMRICSAEVVGEVALRQRDEAIARVSVLEQEVALLRARISALLYVPPRPVNTDSGGGRFSMLELD